jgi:tryptophanyl-tRNA synthetase
MEIQTDSQPIDAKKNPEEDLVFTYHQLFTPEPELSEIRTGYAEGGLGYGDSKKQLLENMEQFLAPLRSKRKEIAAKPDYVKEVLAAGAVKIRPQAQEKLAQVRKVAGLTL